MATEQEASELKQQGVIEAAQDRESSVTADDAQKKMLQESKAAGLTAFTFNPDDSPEEKKAQAKAVSTNTPPSKAPMSLTSTTPRQSPKVSILIEHMAPDS